MVGCSIGGENGCPAALLYRDSVHRYADPTALGFTCQWDESLCSMAEEACPSAVTAVWRCGKTVRCQSENRSKGARDDGQDKINKW